MLDFIVISEWQWHWSMDLVVRVARVLLPQCKKTVEVWVELHQIPCSKGPMVVVDL